MVSNIWHRKNAQKSEDPEKQLGFQEQLVEMCQRLIEYVEKTTQNFSILNTKLNQIQAQVDALSSQTSGSNSHNVDSQKMEARFVELSEDVDKLNKMVNGTIKDYLQEIFLFMQEQKEKQHAEIPL